MPKVMDIEALVRWAFVDELPKEAAARAMRHRGPRLSTPWAGVMRAGALGFLVNAEPNAWGVIPSGCADEPHPDAVLIGQAVARLDDLDVALPEAWSPLDDLADGLCAEGRRLIAEAAGRAFARVSAPADARAGRRLALSVAELVRRCAVTGCPPVWEADRPRLRAVRGERGRERWFRRVTLSVAAGGEYEAEVDGYDARRRRPYPGAYRKYELAPCPLDAAIARAEYEVWHAGLSLLVVDLDGRMEAHRATGPQRPARPWECGMDGAAARGA